MSGESRNIMILELLERALQSWWTVVAGVCIGLAVGTVALARMPMIYEAAARLDLSSEQLPADFFEDTVTGDEDPEAQLAILRRNVLSDPYLETILEEYFGNPTDDATRRRLMQQVRGNVGVFKPRWADYFEIRYRDVSATRSARIANSLAETYVEEKIKYNLRGAQTTVAGLQDLVDEKMKAIRALRTHRSELAADLPFESDLVQRAERIRLTREELGTVKANRKRLESQIDLLRIQALDTDRSPGPGPRPSTGPGTEPILATLEAELRQLLFDKTDNHPDVVKKRKEIERHRQSQGGTVEASPPTPEPQELGFTIWDIQIQSAEAELEKAKTEERRLGTRIASYERQRTEMPKIKGQLDEIDGELRILENEYENLRVRAEQAKTSESVEQQGKGTLFEILNYAVKPSVPISPKPLPVYGVSVAVALVLFVGPMLAKAFLLPVIGSEARLLSLSDVPLLVTIPTITTPGMSRRGRRVWIKNLALSSISILLLVGVTGLRVMGLL